MNVQVMAIDLAMKVAPPKRQDPTTAAILGQNDFAGEQSGEELTVSVRYRVLEQRDKHLI
jgi:hypothetical protein